MMFIAILSIIFFVLAFYALYEFYLAFSASRHRYMRFYVNDNEKAVNWLVEDLEKANKLVKIVGGMAVAEVYNDKHVIKALNDAIKRGVRIQAMFGPVLDKRDNHIMVKLAEEKSLDLFRLPTIPPVHFRLIDDERIFMERPHTLLQKNREVIRPEASSADFLAIHLVRQFEALKHYANKVENPLAEFRQVDVKKDQPVLLEYCAI